MLKTHRWLLASLVLNAALAIGWWRAVQVRSPSVGASQPAALETRRAAENGEMPSAGSVARAPDAAAVSPAADGAAEWPRWLTALRAAGVSERVLAGLVSADFDRRWQQRAVALQRQFEAGNIEADDIAQAHAQRESELEEELQLALGDAGFRAWDRDNTLRDFALNGVALSAEESVSAYELRRELIDHRRAAELAHQRGEIDAVDLRARLDAVEANYHRQLQPLLGAERYAALHGAVATDAGEAALRRRFGALGLAASQIDALVAAQRTRDGQHAEITALADQAEAAGFAYEIVRGEIDAARDQSFERILGAEGFAEFQKSSDPRVQTMRRYATAWRLSDSDIGQVYAALQNHEAAVRELRQQMLGAVDGDGDGASSADAATQEQIARLAEETEMALRTFLGEDRFEKLKRSDALSLER